MTQPPRKPGTGTAKSISNKASLIINLVGATFASLAVWGLWALEHFTDFRYKSETRSEAISTEFVALITVAAYAVALFMWRRRVGILAHGVPITGIIQGLSRPGNGMQDVKVSYSFKGQELTVKTTVAEPDLDGKQVGDSLDLIVDSRKPSRVLVGKH